MYKSICQNPWCKCQYSFDTETPPGQCPKCKSFNNSLSGGVTWNDIVYQEPRMDGKETEVKIYTKTIKT